MVMGHAYDTGEEEAGDGIIRYGEHCQNTSAKSDNLEYPKAMLRQAQGRAKNYCKYHACDQ
jgi:hypothetical protein